MSKKSNMASIVLAFIVLLTACIGSTGIVLAADSPNPVSYFGEMVVNGNRINGSKTGQPMQVKGMSFFWSNWSGPYYNASTVDRMVDEFKVEIVRVAYGVTDGGTPYNTSDEAKLRTVIEAAINRGIYVIIDWHSHGAHDNVDAAKDFFGRMAQDYGSYDNVIFEIYNEPTQIPWSTVKSYAEQVIPVIRQHSNNLIVVGSPTWSQDVDQAANDRIQADNIAYTLHFYAGTHFQYLRDKANYAMNQGLALFCTEWGSVNADGNGSINYNSTNEWLTWLDQNKISWCNWTINDKDETSSIFYSDGSLREAGTFLKSIFLAWVPYQEWRDGSPNPNPTENITFTVKDDWGTGFNGIITIHNTSSSPIKNWTLAFDFEGQIDSFWTANLINHSGNNYVINGKDYNATIQAGESIQLGFTATASSQITPTNYVLTGN